MYSRSPPIGRPRAIRVTDDPHGFDHFGKIERGRFAVHGRIGGDDHFLNRAVAQPLEQLLDAQGVGTDAVERRNRAVQYVIQAAILL